MIGVFEHSEHVPWFGRTWNAVLDSRVITPGPAATIPDPKGPVVSWRRAPRSSRTKEPIWLLEPENMSQVFEHPVDLRI